MSNKHNIGDVTTTSLVLTSKVDNLVILKIPMTYINTHTHMLHMSQRERYIYIFHKAHRCLSLRPRQMNSNGGKLRHVPEVPTHIYIMMYIIYIYYITIYIIIYIYYITIYIYILYLSLIHIESYMNLSCPSGASRRPS
jgi:hypothetical protein